MTDPKIIEAIRSVKIGPFGPNALAIIGKGGKTALTPDEAERIYAAIKPLIAEAWYEGAAQVDSRWHRVTSNPYKEVDE